MVEKHLVQARSAMGNGVNWNTHGPGRFKNLYQRRIVALYIDPELRPIRNGSFHNLQARQGVLKTFERFLMVFFQSLHRSRDSGGYALTGIRYTS